MQIFEMNDTDWWIGESLPACIKDYAKETGDKALTKHARPVPDKDLDSLVYTEFSDDEVATGVKRSFREQLALEIARGGEFPRMFASTEF